MRWGVIVLDNGAELTAKTKKSTNSKNCRCLKFMVGMRGFEPPTPCPPGTFLVSLIKNHSISVRLKRSTSIDITVIYQLSSGLERNLVVSVNLVRPLYPNWDTTPCYFLQ
jgi:hypothetical protein